MVSCCVATTGIAIVVVAVAVAKKVHALVVLVGVVIPIQLLVSNLMICSITEFPVTSTVNFQYQKLFFQRDLPTLAREESARFSGFLPMIPAGPSIDAPSFCFTF